MSNIIQPAYSNPKQQDLVKSMVNKFRICDFDVFCDYVKIIEDSII